MKKTIIYSSILMLLFSCDYYEGPIVVYSFGIWKLEKIEGENTTIMADKLPYEQLIQITSGNRQNYLNIFIDKKLKESIWIEAPINTINKKGKLYYELPISMRTYIKFELTPDSESNKRGRLKLKTSGVIDKTTKIDTVSYYYSYLRSDKNW